MKCEILYGPEAGTIKHFPNNDSTAHTLIRAGALRLVENEPGEMVRTGNGAVIPKFEPAVQPRWFVGMVKTRFRKNGLEPEGAHVGNKPAIVFEVGTTVHEHYCDEPKEAHRGFGRRTVPDDILKQYAKLYKEFNSGR